MKLLSSAVCISMVSARARISDSEKIGVYSQTHPEKLHIEQLIQPWNKTQGPPPRGWYKLKMEVEYGIQHNEVIKKSGDAGQTLATFDFKLSDEHYCRYRNVDGEQCCDRDDQSCYTDAGCFCDEACYTIYGDCCQDHWVTCYDDLKLCLTTAASTENKETGKKGGTYEMEKNRNKKEKNLSQRMMNDLFDLPTPNHVAPNACCGTETYHTDDDCCVEEGGRKFVKRGEECVEEEESEVDERLESPEPGFVYDDEEE
jgi:hypothetical protein